MKQIQKRVVQLVMMGILSLTLWGLMGPALPVQAEVQAPTCGGLTNWIELPVTGGQLDSGNYYLPNDVTLQTNITMSSGTINLNLNSNILTGAIGSNQSIFTVTGGTLNIYDCSNVQKVHNYKIKSIHPSSNQDIYANQSAYSNKLFQRYYDFTEVGDGIIVGGIITGGHKFATQNDLGTNMNYAGGGSAILIGGNGGVVNFYGGTLSGNTSTTLSQWGSKRQRSGTVGIMDGGTFNFYQGQIVGNSSRLGGAGIYLFGSSSMPARLNMYGGDIEDNYSHDTAYNFSNTSSMFIGGGGISTDNIGNGASVVSLSGAIRIVNNYAYDFYTNQYISTNLSYSTESVNSIKILDKLYTEVEGVKTYSSIGLWGGAGEQLTSNYTINGNTHEDVNKIFFADNPTQAVAYNTVNGELKYVVSNLNTLTYHANNGTAQSTTISVVDKIGVSSIMFSKTGHIFSHWNTAADDTGTSYAPDDILTLSSNQALYAIWIAATYTITYQTNGGVFNTPVSLNYTFGTAQLLATPIWTGKTFEGWYDNALLTGSSITQIDETTVGNVTLYAKWSGVNQHTITSVAGSNGSIYPTGSIIYNGTSQDYWIIPSNGYKVSTFMVDGVDKLADILNHKFVVSGVTDDVNIEVTFEKILATDITVFASSGQNGSITPDGFSVVSSGQSITYHMTPNPGYRISDVKVNGVSVGVVSSYTLSNITSTQSITVEFSSLNTIIQSPVIFNLNGGQFIGIYVLPSTYTEGLGLQLPSASELYKANHIFGGWYDNETLIGTPSTYIALTDTGEQAYWAKWIKYSSIITFESNGGEPVSAILQSIGSVVMEPSNPSKLGYTFAGWYSEESLTTAYTFTTMPDESITLYAKWTINQYTITFDSNGGSAVNAITQDFGTAIIEPANPTKLGYTFAGWSVSVPANMPAENITLVANWTINQYTITFDSNGGSAVNEITQDFGTAIISPANPTKLGYTFAGWSVSVPANMPAENITLVANWTINQYTITFDSNGGSEVNAITQDFGTVITAPATPTKLGYTFAGWSAAVPASMPAENMILTASWTINQYTITFDSNGGSAVNAITQDFGTAVIAPATPTKLGYTFAGWSAAVPASMPAENLTLVASWTINQYTITFDSNGGSAVNAITQDFGTAVIAPANPTKLGYTFAGWSAAVPASMPAENMILTASWTINQYTITFDSNGGSAVNAITQDFGTAIIEPATPTKLGYTFAGWSVSVPANMPAENITLVANWTINQYTITFDSNGGSEVNAITQDFGTVITAPATPTKLGYTFAGWSVSVPANMPAENITLVANWTINQYTITFDSNGGSVVNSITQDFGTAIIEPATPTKLGYTFAGWSVSVPANMPAENITLVASWTINTYTITFDTKGGSSIQTLSFEFGETIVQPNNPTKSGFRFNGWNQSLPTVMPAENIVLVAYWLKVTDASSEHGSSNSQALINAIDAALLAQKDAEVSIVFERKEPTTIHETIKNSIESILKQNQKYAIMDIRVVIKSQGQADIEVQELNDKISITLTLSKAEQGHKNYQIIAVHNGQARIIECVYDSNQQTITFETDQFSTFAIVYETSSYQWGWWFLVLLIPIGFVTFKYRKDLLSLVSKK